LFGRINRDGDVERDRALIEFPFPFVFGDFIGDEHNPVGVQVTAPSDSNLTVNESVIYAGKHERHNEVLNY